MPLRAAHHEDEEATDQKDRQQGADQQAKELAGVVGLLRAERHAVGVAATSDGGGANIVVDIGQLCWDLHLVGLWWGAGLGDGQDLLLLHNGGDAAPTDLGQECRVVLRCGWHRGEEDAAEEHHGAQKQDQHDCTVSQSLRNH